MEDEEPVISLLHTERMKNFLRCENASQSCSLYTGIKWGQEVRMELCRANLLPGFSFDSSSSIVQVHLLTFLEKRFSGTCDHYESEREHWDSKVYKKSKWINFSLLAWRIVMWLWLLCGFSPQRAVLSVFLPTFYLEPWAKCKVSFPGWVHGLCTF